MDRLLVFTLDGEHLGQTVDDDGIAYGRIDVPSDLAPGWYDPNVLEMTFAERAQVQEALGYRFMTADEARIVVLDGSLGIQPDDSKRGTYTDEMRREWDTLQQWYVDHPGATVDVSNELEVDTEDDPAIIAAARGE
jgi:hypothetical protein